MLIYLDLCCFNRPWDDQSSTRLRIETEAKLVIQERIRVGQDQLVWSYVLGYENSLNPFAHRREAIQQWSERASTRVAESEMVLVSAQLGVAAGLSTFDALHVACAKAAGAQLFVTTDDRLLRVARRAQLMDVALPQDALAKLEAWYEN